MSPRNYWKCVSDKVSEVNRCLNFRLGVVCRKARARVLIQRRMFCIKEWRKMPNDQHHSRKYSGFMLHANHETISHSKATKEKKKQFINFLVSFLVWAMFFLCLNMIASHKCGSLQIRSFIIKPFELAVWIIEWCHYRHFSPSIGSTISGFRFIFYLLSRFFFIHRKHSNSHHKFQFNDRKNNPTTKCCVVNKLLKLCGLFFSGVKSHSINWFWGDGKWIMQS